MDAKSIETLAVNEFTSRLVISAHLEPFIATNDKEPFFDGNVYIYDDKSKGKKDYKGRVPVQVKGKEASVEEMGKSKVSYPVDTADLRGYLIEGGVIFVVVLVSKVSRKIYYRELAPIFLKQIIGSLNEKQKSKTIELYPLPCDDNQLASVFLNFAKNCEKQRIVNIDSRLPSIEDLQNAGVLENITTSVTGYGFGKNIDDVFLSHETYLYAKIKGTDILQPLDGVQLDKYISRSLNVNVKIGETIYFTECVYTKNANKQFFKIGEGIIFEETPGNKTASIRYIPSPWLRKQKKDLAFFIKLITTQKITIGNLEIDLRKMGFDCSSYDLEGAKKHLEILEEAIKTLEKLRFYGDLNLKEMNEEDYRNLSRLTDAILYKKEVNHLKDNLPPILSLRIADKSFVVVLEKNEKELGTYKMYDFFNKDVPMIISVENQKKPITQFAILTNGDLSEIANMDFEKISNAFPTCCKEDYQVECFNMIMLNMIKAYDKNGDGRFLDVARKIQDQIDALTNCYIDESIRLINRLQINKRMGACLSEEDEENLFEIVQNGKDALIQVGAAIILEDKKALNLFLKRLSDEQVDDIKRFPIWNLIN